MYQAIAVALGQSELGRQAETDWLYSRNSHAVFLLTYSPTLLPPLQRVASRPTQKMLRTATSRLAPTICTGASSIRNNALVGLSRSTPLRATSVPPAAPFSSMHTTNGATRGIGTKKKEIGEGVREEKIRPGERSQVRTRRA